jgi:hypothetical protein
MGGWVGGRCVRYGWAACEVWVDRWVEGWVDGRVEREGKGGVRI